MEVVITHCRQWPVVSDQSEFAAIKVLVELLHSIDEEQALFFTYAKFHSFDKGYEMHRLWEVGAIRKNVTPCHMLRHFRPCAWAIASHNGPTLLLC